MKGVADKITIFLSVCQTGLWKPAIQYFASKTTCLMVFLDQSDSVHGMIMVGSVCFFSLNHHLLQDLVCEHSAVPFLVE